MNQPLNRPSGWLVLVPTQLERKHLGLDIDVPVEICGFGPVAAAARTSTLIAECQPQQIMLVGIAGAYADRLQIGMAYEFDRVRCVGVGIGGDQQHISAGEAGWMHYPPSQIGDELTLATSRTDQPTSGCLLTVCAAAADSGEAANRIARHPDALAEDMEGFGVATAAAIAGEPLHIVRGISNTAGQREHSSWQIEPAMLAASALASSIMQK